jgi:hypothetical protein
MGILHQDVDDGKPELVGVAGEPGERGGGDEERGPRPEGEPPAGEPDQLILVG